MRAGIAIIDELVALALGHPFGTLEILGFAAGRAPGFSAVVRALDDLSKPAARLRSVDAIGICRGGFHVVNLPSAKQRAGNVPLLPIAVGGADEPALLCADENANAAHGGCPFSWSARSLPDVIWMRVKVSGMIVPPALPVSGCTPPAQR